MRPGEAGRPEVVVGPAGPGLWRASWPALGTRCEVQMATPSLAVATEAARRAADWVEAFEERYSAYRPGSWVNQLRAAAGGAEAVPLTPADEELLAAVDTAHWLTQGTFDPTVGPLLRLWKRPAAEGREAPGAAEVERARGLVGWARVERGAGWIRLPVAGMALDFGGFGKEWAVDAVADLLAGCGLEAWLVDFGRDLAARGTPPGPSPWVIGLEDPRAPGTSFAVIGLKDGALAGSGCYLPDPGTGRPWRHLVDPRSGYPPASDVLACNVLSSSCVAAGLLSTSALILGSADGYALLANHPGTEGCLFTRQRFLETPGFGAVRLGR